MEIEKIIYDSTRSIYNVEDKLSIATVFIFCWKHSNKSFAELLYCYNHEIFVEKLNQEFKNYEVDFTIRLSDRNVRECFEKTLDKVKEKYDAEGFYKALYDGDPFAAVIDNIVSTEVGKFEVREFVENVSAQLALNL